MKKNIILLGSLILSSLAYSQVGINNETPKATLDVSAKTTDGTKPEGIIAPRLTGDQIKSADTQYDTAQIGTIVYATAAVGTSTPKTINITSPGYYYFDNTLVWVKFGSGTGTSTPEPWYIQNTTTPASANTQNIYQQGKVAVGFNNTDALSGKQFEVKGDVKAAVNNAGTYSVLETNNTAFGLPLNIMFSTDNPNVMSATNYGAVSTTINGAALNAKGVDGEASMGVDFNSIYKSRAEMSTSNSVTNIVNSITLGSNGATEQIDKIILRSENTPALTATRVLVDKTEGVTFKYGGISNPSGNYTFPQNNGTAGQVLVTNGAASTLMTGAQLSWQNVSNLVPEPWQIATTTNPATANTQNIYQMGNVGVGTTTPTGRLHVIETVTSEGTTKWPNIYGYQTVNLGGTAVRSYRGADINTEVVSNTSFSDSVMGARVQALDTTGSTYTGTNGAMYGLYSSVDKRGSGTVATMKGIQNYTFMSSGSATAINLYGIHNRLDLFSSAKQPTVYGIMNEVRGNSTNSFGIYKGIASDVVAQFTADNFYAFYAGSQIDTFLTSANKWSFYSDNNLPNYFKGNVGIGINTPTTKLQIVSTTAGTGFNLQDSSQGAGKVLTSDANGNASWQTSSAIPTEPWQVQGGTTAATTNAQDIYQTGNVSIGSSTPIAPFTSNSVTVTPKLSVAGDVASIGAYYTTTGKYADYVFEDYFDGSSKINADYDFKSLAETAAYIKANKHLPGVTSIKDILKTENGYTVNLSELSIQQLEKIEELYLHTIEQQEEISKQKTEINDLKSRMEKLEQLLSKENNK